VSTPARLERFHVLTGGESPVLISEIRLSRDENPRKINRWCVSAKARDTPGTASLALRVGFIRHREQIIAHSRDVVAQKGHLCARRELLAKLDTSQNWIEVCSDF
jgi:hypothetical protein